MIGKEIDVDIVFEDLDILAFNDISPQAPVHVIVIPKKHISGLNDVGEEDMSVLAKLIKKAACIASERGIAEEGYRVVVNCNSHGGQEVFHLHVHLLGGRQFHWPPG